MAGIMDIPTILSTIKPFNGNTEDYALFITRFNALVHHNPTIDDILKQNILISLLEGDSKELITSDQLSPESYADLRQNLEMVYNRTGDRKNQLLDNYRKLPFHQTDNDMMDKDVMKHVCLANSLERLQFSMDNTLVIKTFIEKLPSQIMRMVIKKNQRNSHHSPSFMETVKLVRTLISENRSVEEAEKRRKETTQINEVCTAEVNKLSTTRDKIPHHHSDGKKSYGHDQLAQRQPSPFATYRLAPCIFCAKDHESFKCTISTQEKVEAINKQKDICRNCLFRNHRTDKCKSRFACPTCKRKHHSSLCLEKSKMDTLVNLLSSTTSEELKTFFRTNGVEPQSIQKH
uniref:Uncharacterized protein n=1 Tax=Caenorhabditis japonica TaxID=281687 RepID=A0A8R1E825_CAEJA